MRRLYAGMLGLAAFGLAAHDSSAAPADCASYVAQAKELNSEVQTMIGRALEQRLDVSSASCLFRSDEWSVREEKHRTWCAGKETAAVDARLASMTQGIAACSATLRSGGDVGSQGSGLSAGNVARVLRFDLQPIGPLANDFLQTAGARIVDAQGQARVFAAEPNMVLPSGRTRVVLVVGDRTTSLTLAFDEPVARFTLTRIGTANGASTPTWKLEAFDGGGALLGSTGEERGLPLEARQFAIAAQGIARVVLTTDNRWGDGTWATWSSLPVVEIGVER